MKRSNNNSIANVPIMKALQHSSNQKVIQEKLRTESVDFLHSFSPVYYYSRMFGLMPFSIKCDTNRGTQKPQVNLFDVIWFFLSISVYILMALISYNDMKLPQDSNAASFILILGDYVLLILGLIYSALIIVFDMYNRFKLIEILNKFMSFDKEVSNLGIQYDYKKENRHAWVFATIPVALNLIFILLSSYFYKIAIGHLSTLGIIHFFVSYIIKNATSILAAISFITLSCNLRQRFGALNLLLRNHFMNGNTLKLAIGVRKKDAIDTIKFVGRQHSFLTGIMNDMNFCYSFQMMFNTASVFIFSVLTIYTFYRYLIQQTEFFREHSLVHFIWQIFYLSNTLMVIYMANSVTDEGKNTFEIVHDILNSGHEPDLALTLTQLSQQTQHRYPVASCGLFPFDWTLLFAMVSSVTTYVTILLNFESSENGDVNQNGT